MMENLSASGIRQDFTTQYASQNLDMENRHKHKTKKKCLEKIDSEDIGKCSPLSDSDETIATPKLLASNMFSGGENRHKHKKKKKRKLSEQTDSGQVKDCSLTFDTSEKIASPQITSSVSEDENKRKQKKRKILTDSEMEEIGECSFSLDNHDMTRTTENLLSTSISDVENKHKHKKKKKKKKMRCEEESEQIEEFTSASDVTQENISPRKSSTGISANEKRKEDVEKKRLVKSETTSEQNGECLVPSDALFCTNASESSVKDETLVTNIKQEVPDERAAAETESSPGIIPLTVSSEVSAIIHGSNRVFVNNNRSSDFLLHNFGIRLRQGKWTPEEDEILRKNYKKALKKIPEDDHQHILYISKHDPIPLQNRIRKLIEETRFYSKLGHKLNRLPVSCLKRAKHLFQDYKVTGNFSEAERKELDRLMLIHGHQWKAIGKIMGRSAYSVASHFHKFRHEGGKGPFTPLELQQLEKAVQDVRTEYGIPDDQYQNLPWAEIARRVPTRSVMQCKFHWLRRLQNCEPGEAVFKHHENKKLLVELIYKSEVGHEYDIDWTNIAKQISSKLTPQYLQRYWNIMKKTYVPDCALMSFDEIREFLYKKFHS